MLFPGMGKESIWEIQRHLIILNSSLSYPAHSQTERASKSAFILLRGSIRNHSCTDFWPASGCFFFFLKTFSLLRAARCSTTLDKFTDLKSPHKCFLNCSVLSGSSASLVPGSHHVSILQSLFIFIFMHSPNRKPVVIRICILVIAATLPTPRAPSASWKVPQSEGSHYSQQTHKRENRQSHRRREFKTPQPFLIVPGNMQTRVLPSRKQEPEVGLD